MWQLCVQVDHVMRYCKLQKLGCRWRHPCYEHRIGTLVRKKYGMWWSASRRGREGVGKRWQAPALCLAAHDATSCGALVSTLCAPVSKRRSITVRGPHTCMYAHQRLPPRFEHDIAILSLPTIPYLCTICRSACSI